MAPGQVVKTGLEQIQIGNLKKDFNHPRRIAPEWPSCRKKSGAEDLIGFTVSSN